MNAAARIQAQNTAEQPSDRAMRLMGRAIDAIDRGRIREASDWMDQANRAVQVILQFQDARAGRT